MLYCVFSVLRFLFSAVGLLLQQIRGSSSLSLTVGFPFFLSFLFLYGLPFRFESVSAAVRQQVFCLSAFLFCQLVWHYMRFPDVCLSWSCFLALSVPRWSSGVRIRLLVIPHFSCVSQIPSVPVGLTFSFFHLPSLSSFGNYCCRLPAGFLHIRLSVLPDCVSLHATVLFLFSYRLV